MWKLVNGKLTQTTDYTRVKFRTNISKAILVELCEIAIKHDTHPNYLLESGLQQILSNGTITFDKNLRPNDRIQYKTTYDKELLENIREFAKQQNVFINDIIEYSVKFIDLNNVKNTSYKHRIENS
ncbi:rRNA methyltransferase [Metabacillus halosaccharovorans]|uniref:rRNA methyltransferase n=1 Tax=Metabacillus halosaccharovorans TaxID=930124 RepID=UPI002040310D|nr:rRNA methyltransferase [Metabacillus halosaccharovorans]MCM3439593.1 rRNA methyltransferase [Metabacillus halosaccharovorans]